MTARATTAAASRRARRCQRVNHDLLDAIGRALDERRSRETDRLAVLSTSFAVAIALVAFLTGIDVVWKRDQAISGLYLPGSAVQITVGVILGILVFGGATVIYRSLRGWPLTDSTYFRRYERLRQFLRAASTDSLARFDQDDNIGLDAWNELDTELSARLADLLDDLFPGSDMAHLWEYRQDELPAETGPTKRALFPGRRERRKDVDLLRRRVEDWSLQSLLITERPRVLWDPKLPLLACLYRFRLYEFTLAGFRAKDPDHGGSKAARWDEFTLALNEAGFSIIQHDVIQRWAQVRRKHWTSANVLLEDLNRVKIRSLPKDDPEKIREQAGLIMEAMERDMVP